MIHKRYEKQNEINALHPKRSDVVGEEIYVSSEGWICHYQELYNNYSMSPRWIWSDKITNERVARVGYNHFISNKGEWNNCFSKF